MIEVSGLTKRYGSRTAVRDISLSIPEGKVIGLLGFNGAGKSTIMNILAGCLSSTSGRVVINGFDIEEEPEEAKKSTGYLPEMPPLYTDMKVSEYLDFVFELKKVRENRKPHLEEVCRQTGIEAVRGRLIKNLSKGYRQRVGLAAALTGSPKLLILDEPTVGLDPAQIIEIRSLIKKLGERSTVLLSSHILPEVRAVCDRVIVLNQGRIAADGNPGSLGAEASGYALTVEGEPEAVEAALRAAPGVRSVRRLGREGEGEAVWEYEVSGDPGRDLRRDLSRALLERGLLLLSTRQPGPGFERIFLDLAGGEGADDDPRV